jgi:hypothetical protein
LTRHNFSPVVPNMAVPTLSRHSRPSSPSTLSTPARTKFSRAVSPSRTSTSYSPTLTPGHQQKLNVVTRVAIEGKARQGQDGASMKMYLKVGFERCAFQEILNSRRRFLYHQTVLHQEQPFPSFLVSGRRSSSRIIVILLVQRRT